MSKLAVWTTWFRIASQMSRNSAEFSRMGLSDTDSIVHCMERKLALYEQWEHLLLKKTNKTILYKDSIIAHEMASSCYRAWHSILDYSSLSEKSIIFQAFFAKSEAHATMLRYLAISTRKALFKWQSESNFISIQTCHAPSPKSYALTLWNEEKISLPFIEPISNNKAYPSLPNNDPLNRIGAGKEFMKKTKGLRKNVLTYQTRLSDFVLATRTNKTSRSVRQFAIKKQHLKLYIVSQNKMLLSRVIMKRLAFQQLSKPWCCFTYPLCFKRLLNLD